MRKFAVLGGVMVAAAALAVTVIVGAKGTGGAVDSVGTKYGFAIDAKKATVEGVNRVSGYFRVRREYREGDRKFVVELSMVPDELGKVENVVNMAGPTRRIIRRDGVVIREDHGRMTAKVTDRRFGDPPAGEPDLIAFTYRINGTTTAVQFNGKVYWGDIAVYRREEQ